MWGRKPPAGEVAERSKPTVSHGVRRAESLPLRQLFKGLAEQGARFDLRFCRRIANIQRFLRPKRRSIDSGAEPKRSLERRRTSSGTREEADYSGCR